MMMVKGTAVVTGVVVVKWSGLVPHAFFADLSLGHALGSEAVLEALPSILCRRPCLGLGPPPM
jgi:hypothetical protein